MIHSGRRILLLVALTLDSAKPRSWLEIVDDFLRIIHIIYNLFAHFIFLNIARCIVTILALLFLLLKVLELIRQKLVDDPLCPVHVEKFFV